MTVTEVYSGVNCRVTATDNESKAVLAAEEDGSTEPVSFRFVNEYDEGANRGYGVENQFRYVIDQQTGQSGYQWNADRTDIRAETQTDAGGNGGTETGKEVNADENVQ